MRILEPGRRRRRQPPTPTQLLWAACGVLAVVFVIERLVR